jgi:hypothetical protein
VAAIKIAKRGKGPDRGDNSNAQYAALGLRACASAGLQLPDEVFTAAAKWWEKNQGKDGGWGYSDAGQVGDPSYGSMTAGGVASLIILRNLLRQETEKFAPIKKAMDWMAQPRHGKPRLRTAVPVAPLLALRRRARGNPRGHGEAGRPLVVLGRRRPPAEGAGPEARILDLGKKRDGIGGGRRGRHRVCDPVLEKSY